MEFGMSTVYIIVTGIASTVSILVYFLVPVEGEIFMNPRMILNRFKGESPYKGNREWNISVKSKKFKEIEEKVDSVTKKICLNCGYDIPKKYAFCGKCGFPVSPHSKKRKIVNASI